MKHSRQKPNRGFVLLFAVTLAGILLAIALGVSNIAEKEISFGTSARDTSNAFLAADTGIECAIFYDKTVGTAFSVGGGQEPLINCASQNIPIAFNGVSYDLVIPGLGSAGASCAKVNVLKENDAQGDILTTIVSKGYNIGDDACASTNPRRVERELQVSYTTDNPAPPVEQFYPYGGTIPTLPGKIQAENFDDKDPTANDEGYSYHDLSPQNEGSSNYRASESVDIDTTIDTGGGYRVSNAQAGEWLNYSVEVPEGGAGLYELTVRVGNNISGGTLKVKSKGYDITGTLTVPSGGGIYKDITAIVTLGEGRQIITLEMLSNAPGDTEVGSINYLDFQTYVAPNPPVFVRSGSDGDNTLSNFDIGTAGTNRLVLVIAGVESETSTLSGVTVGGKSCTLVQRAHNSDPAGTDNHMEMWYCDEDNLGSTAGLVTVSLQGGSTAWATHALLFTGAAQSGPADSGINQTALNTSSISVSGITVSKQGLVVAGWGDGSEFKTMSAQTSPLTLRQDGQDPTSADLFSSSGIEVTAQTNKTYTATLSSVFNRGTGIVASWAPAP